MFTLFFHPFLILPCTDPSKMAMFPKQQGLPIKDQKDDTSVSSATIKSQIIYFMMADYGFTQRHW